MPISIEDGGHQSHCVHSLNQVYMSLVNVAIIILSFVDIFHFFIIE